MFTSRFWFFSIIVGLSLSYLAAGCSSEGTPITKEQTDGGIVSDQQIILHRDIIAPVDQARLDAGQKPLIPEQLNQPCTTHEDCGDERLGCSPLPKNRCLVTCSAQNPCPGAVCSAGGFCPLCGDGFCAQVELKNPALCPADCAVATSGKKEPFSLVNPASGVTLWGNIYLPEGAGSSKRYPAMALVPGGTGDGRSFELKGTTTELVERGIIALTFDLDGRGQSEGTEDQCGHIHQDAIKALVEYLAARPEVEPSRIGLFSSSFGITCASGALARYSDSLPVKFLVDNEGPANRNDTGHCDTASDTGHITHDCTDDPWWSEREASEHIKGVKVPYLRLQYEKDHVQPDNTHALLMINNATHTQHGGQGVAPWTLVNNETINPINTVYTVDQPPVWLQKTTGQTDVDFMETMLKTFTP